MRVAVKYSPRKQVIIHELVPYDDFESMLSDMMIGVPAGAQLPPFRWVDGIILYFTTLLPDTDTLAKERISGIIHWDNVIFAKMEKFQSVVKHEGRTFQIMDVSRNETFKEIGKFLNQYLTRPKKTNRATK